MILAVPIQEPGTKLASEYHGGKQGRFCYHQKAENGHMTFEPAQCRRCKQQTVVFDEREVPYCTNCNEVHGSGPRTQFLQKTMYRHSRARRYKKFRLYGQQSFKPEG
ncbi:Uncharacterised protein [uncultured archaeon]|nr:Uncharacterised protein [uncultured archaeon]